MNMTRWNNSVWMSSHIENSTVHSELVYDSAPFTDWQNFWTLYGSLITYIGIGLGAGLIGFGGFFWYYGSKCKINPNYSKVCKIYKKPSPKSKQSDNTLLL